MRVFLVTLSPGEELTRAFGHAALVFDDGNAAAGLPTYSYGGFALPELRLHFDRGNAWDAIGASVLEALLPVVQGTFRAKKLRETFERMKLRAGPFQSMLVDELALTAAQRELLQRRMHEDFERVEPGEKAQGLYRYNHFFNNCVTRLRDQIFAVLEDGPALHQRPESDESFEKILEEALADAIAACPFGVRLFPAEVEPGLLLFAPGIMPSALEPRDFLRSLRLTLGLLAKTRAFGTPTGRAALQGALRVLDDEIPRKPRSFPDTLFTPKRLRAALAGWTNPKTGEPLLASARVTRFDEVQH